MINHEHAGEAWVDADLRQHVIDGHPEVSASGPTLTVSEAHQEDHLRAVREALALSGQRTSGVAVTGMPIIRPQDPALEARFVTPTMTSPANPKRPGEAILQAGESAMPLIVTLTPAQRSFLLAAHELILKVLNDDI